MAMVGVANGGQNLHTSQWGQAHTIQIVRAHERDLTMTAAGQAYGLAPVCDRYNNYILIIANNYAYVFSTFWNKKFTQ